MRAGRGLPLALILVVAFAGCAYGLIQDGRLRADRLEDIRRGVESIHGMGFRDPAPVVVLCAPELRLALGRTIDEEYPPPLLDHLARAWAAFGLLPEGYDLRASLLDLAAEQGAAFYDPTTKRLVVSDRDLSRGILLPLVQFLLRRDLAHELVLAHELTHALQDQHVNLRKRIWAIEGDDDRASAYQALVEGAATLAGMAYVSRRFDDVPRLPGRLHEKLAEEALGLGPAFRKAPLALRETLLFPYAEGTEFTRALLRRRGWSGIVRAYRRPPLSTEEILQPEKYLAESDPPLDFDLGAAEGPPVSTWRLIDDNVLGEYLIAVLLRTLLPARSSPSSFLGWGGDRYRVYDRGDGGKPALLWALVFDREPDAERFFETYRDALKAKTRRPGGALPAAESPTKARFAAGDLETRLERRGRRIAVVENLPRGIAGDWIERISQVPAFPRRGPGVSPEIPRSSRNPAGPPPRENPAWQ